MYVCLHRSSSFLTFLLVSTISFELQFCCSYSCSCSVNSDLSKADTFNKYFYPIFTSKEGFLNFNYALNSESCIREVLLYCGF